LGALSTLDLRTGVSPEIDLTGGALVAVRLTCC
jgi:hypothetical protein